MRNWIRYSKLIPVLLVAQVFSACTQGEIPVNESDGPVTVSLAFSLSNTSAPKTRMAQTVWQLTGLSQIQDVKILPFEVADITRGVNTGDRLKAFSLNGFEAETNSEKTNSWFCYFQRCSFMRGTNAVLFYGRANPKLDPLNSSSTIANKAYNGCLNARFPADMDPASIGFDLEQMRKENTVPEEASTIAQYLTDIANAEGWATATDTRLRALYLNFVGDGSDNTTLFAGSSASVTAYVNDLKTILNGLSDSDIKTAILAKIGTPSLGNYPGKYGLPDGAAALRWTKLPDSESYGFVPQTVTTTSSNINNLTRFVYPPELYFFCNSSLKTNTEAVAYSVYTANTEWETVLGSYSDNATVSANTKAVAVKKPVQYAVGRLQMDLNYPTGDHPLKDGRNEDVFSTQLTMPLKGMIISGQYNVDYEFLPSGIDNRFIYDSNVSGTTANTLVLQSKKDEEVFIILEFMNETGKSFMGENGIIYPHTKFYLIGKIDPKSQTATADYAGRAFTQDYTTEVSMKFAANSLSKAYNVLPNLLAPRLEIGVLLTPDWEVSTPVNVPLPD